MIPGSNVLNMAFQAIAKQSVGYLKFVGRVTNSIGVDVAFYEEPVTLLGSFQPVPRRLYQQYGLDLQKNYATLYVSNDMLDVTRDVSGDQIIRDDRVWQCESETDWFRVDGWTSVLCVDVGPVPDAAELVSVSIDATGERAVLTYSGQVFGSPIDGFSFDGTDIQSAVLAGNTIIMTIGTVFLNQTVTMSFNASTGDLTSIGGAVASVADFPADNKSQEIPPTASYPLADDGTVAAVLGLDFAPAIAPAYHRVDWTFGNTADYFGTAPAVGTYLTTQAIEGSSGKKLAVEFEIIAPPSGGQFAFLALAIAVSNGVVIGFQPEAFFFTNVDGSTPELLNTDGTPLSITSSLAGFRAAALFDCSARTCTVISTDGNIAASDWSSYFNVGDLLTFFLYLQDTGSNGDTLSYRIVPNAADMTLTYPAGYTDYAGNACPTA